MARRRHIFFSLVVCAFAAACGGSDGPTDPIVDDGDGNTGGSARTIKANPSFAQDVQEILSRNGCTASGCHGGSAGGLTLGGSAAANNGALVGVTGSANEVYVIANDANNSYLVKKLEGRGSG